MARLKQLSLKQKDMICPQEKVFMYFTMFCDQFDNIHWPGMDIKKSTIQNIIGHFHE